MKRRRARKVVVSLPPGRAANADQNGVGALLRKISLKLSKRVLMPSKRELTVEGVDGRVGSALLVSYDAGR